MRFKCNKKEPCIRCLECCHFRDKRYLDDSDDLLIRKQMFEKTGILYLEPFWRYTISVTEEEKKLLQSSGKELGIKVIIKPKKIMININKKPVVIDWYVDHDKCPFLKGNKCIIYEKRPEICRCFPKTYLNRAERIKEKADITFREAIELGSDAV